MNRLVIAGASVLMGFTLTISALTKGQPTIAIALFLASIYVGLSIITGFLESLENPIFQGSAAIIGTIGIIGVFTYSRAFNAELQQAHKDAFASFTQLNQHCQPTQKNLLALQKLGIKVCALQEGADQKLAVIDLAKGLHLGPSLTLLDSAASASNDSPPDYCALAYKAAVSICPAAFSSLSDKNRAALLDTIKQP